jgi:hypothetical protein
MRLVFTFVESAVFKRAKSKVKNVPAQVLRDLKKEFGNE